MFVLFRVQSIHMKTWNRLQYIEYFNLASQCQAVSTVRVGVVVEPHLVGAREPAEITAMTGTPAEQATIVMTASTRMTMLPQ